MGANPLINLHTHTTLSDGSFTPEEIVSAAKAGHLSHVAITDHFETSKVRSLPSREFPKYLSRIRELNRSNNGISILAGVEIDTNPLRCDLDGLPIDSLNQLDLVLFEYVGGVRGSSLEEIADLLRRVEVPCGLAHSDIATIYADKSPEELADHLCSFGVFVELNTASPYSTDGVSYYERAEEYYRAFKGKVKVSVGTDTHRHITEVANVGAPYQFIRRLGLENDLLFK